MGSRDYLFSLLITHKFPLFHFCFSKLPYLNLLALFHLVILSPVLLRRGVIVGLGEHLVLSQDQTTTGTKHAPRPRCSSSCNQYAHQSSMCCIPLGAACCLPPLPSHPQCTLLSPHPCATLLPWTFSPCRRCSLHNQITLWDAGGTTSCLGAVFANSTQKGLSQSAQPHIQQQREAGSTLHGFAMHVLAPAALSSCTSLPLLQEPQCTFKMSPMTSPFS